ncbi:MAG: phasin family protein [Gammaproteobacteria bacterium]|nr:phasin family protein [Gammaproteobacteria bacterium]
MNIQIEKFVAPIQELVALNVANIEKLVNIQVEAIEEAAKTGVDTLKQVAEIKDIEGVKSHFASLTDVVRTTVENAVVRSKSVAGIFQAYPGSVKSIVENAVKIG